MSFALVNEFSGLVVQRRFRLHCVRSTRSLKSARKLNCPSSRLISFQASSRFTETLLYSGISPSVSTTNDEGPQILGTSPASTKKRPNIAVRFIRWIESLIRKLKDAVLFTIRGTEVLLRFSPLLILAPASMISAHLSTDNNCAVVSDATWTYTRSAITALGPAFVKLFQWVATRRDIFPPHVCDRLSILHDRGVPHAWKHTHATLATAFGEDYAEKGLFVEKLIGCGSAAQVYKGTLTQVEKKSGKTVVRPVAVKVLHPNMDAKVERDLWFVQTFADFLHSLPVESIRIVNVPRAVSNFGSILRKQSDMTVEAGNLAKFRENFYGENNDSMDSKILFPQPMKGWVCTEVLVEDLVENARSIAEFANDSSKEGIKIRRELASPLLRAFLKMVFLDNFVHCDLHAGNILIQDVVVTKEPGLWDSIFSKETSHNSEGLETKRQLVFIDAGIATALDPISQRNLIDLFKAVVLNKGYEAGRLMVQRAKYERCSQIEGGVDAFASGIAELVSEFHDRRLDGLTLGAVRIGSLLSRVLDLCRTYRVEIDPSMASIVISILVLEGLGRSLEPNMNLMDFAMPFVLGRGRV